jgi:hypothetical protein
LIVFFDLGIAIEQLEFVSIKEGVTQINISQSELVSIDKAIVFEMSYEGQFHFSLPPPTLQLLQFENGFGI